MSDRAPFTPHTVFGAGISPLTARRLRFLPRPRAIFRGMVSWANLAAICRSYRAAVPRS